MTTYIFPVLPHADTEAVRVLLRTFAGLEDFARVNAHYKRRITHPDLTLDCFKRKCLFCLVEHEVHVLDTEWHAIYECPCTNAARTRFRINTAFRYTCPNPCTANDLCPLVKFVAADSRLSGFLAQFAFDIRATRRHIFRRFSSTGPSGRAFVAGQLARLQPVQDLAHVR